MWHWKKGNSQSHNSHIAHKVHSDATHAAVQEHSLSACFKSVHTVQQTHLSGSSLVRFLVTSRQCGTQVEVHKCALSPHNALALVSGYNVVLDCTDNAPTRYLISDACVVASKPLVSGAAIGTDGQLTVYNHGEDGGISLVFVRSMHSALG